MPATSLQSLIEQRRREGGHESDRFVDLDLKLVAEGTGELLIQVGGRWDRRLKRYVGGEAPRSRVLRVHEGQRDAARYLAGWFKDHLRGVKHRAEDRIYSAMLGGGQRSGKTWLGVAGAVAYAVASPFSIVWIVSPAERDHEEVQDYLRSMMPRAWYTELGAPWYRYRLPNGAKIVLRTGHEPDKLKKGDADFVILNEAQQQKERAFAICRGRIAASGGLVVVCANPPQNEIGQWVGDFAVEAQDGLRQAKFFHLDPLDNPHIDHGPLLAMAKEFDQRTFDTEVRGMFLGERNAALYNWSRADNERITPTAPSDEVGREVGPEITREVLRALEGREYDRVIGVDVQRFPFMAAAEFRFFSNPLATTPAERIEWALMWCTSSLIMRAADEADLATAWLDAGFDPTRTLIVCDASGEWQFAERDPTKVKELRERVKGRGSFDVFRDFGFRHVVKPDRDSDRNPDIIERFRATTSRVCTAQRGPFGQRFLFSDPRNKELNKALRSLQVKQGKPSRTSQWAHGCDAFTYAVHRLYPRRTKSEPKVSVVKRYARRDQMRSAF
jgi:hypothetical protein